MAGALRAEWTKLRTVSGTAWLLLASVAVTVGISAVAAATSCPDGGCAADVGTLSLSGVRVGQLLVAVLAVVAVSNEYGTGMIRTSLAAVPRRWGLLVAKSVVVAAAVLAAAAVAVVGSLLAAWPALPDPHLSAALVRAAVGSVLYLVLIGLLSLGVALVVRDSATSIGAVLGLLFLVPILASTMSNPDWHRHLMQISPMTAGLAVQETAGLAGRPIGPLAGLAVLAAWSAGALLLGAVLLQRRDA